MSVGNGVAIQPYSDYQITFVFPQNWYIFIVCLFFNNGQSSQCFSSNAFANFCSEFFLSKSKHFCSHFFALHGGVTLRVETVWQTKPPFTTRPSNAVIGDQATCYNFERTKYCSDIFYYNMDWKWWLKWNVASPLNVIRRGHIFKAIIEPVHQSHQDKFILFKQTFANVCNKSTKNSYEQKTSKIIWTV